MEEKKVYLVRRFNSVNNQETIEGIFSKQEYAQFWMQRESERERKDAIKRGVDCDFSYGIYNEHGDYVRTLRAKNGTEIRWNVSMEYIDKESHMYTISHLLPESDPEIDEKYKEERYYE